MAIRFRKVLLLLTHSTIKTCKTERISKYLISVIYNYIDSFYTLQNRGSSQLKYYSSLLNHDCVYSLQTAVSLDEDYEIFNQLFFFCCDSVLMKRNILKKKLSLYLLLSFQNTGHQNWFIIFLNQTSSNDCSFESPKLRTRRDSDRLFYFIV